MEQYLINEYNVFEDEDYLTNENQIEEYFKDNGRDWLDCGQGYAQNEAEIICKIGEKFYNVSIEAEIGNSEQDYGDRLYYIDYISYVKYEEINKPLPKEKEIVEYELLLTKRQKKLLEDYMKEIHIKF